MTMTKKHFIAIAEIIKKNLSIADNEISEKPLYYTSIELITNLSNYFKTENPNFDEVKFKEACLN